MDIFLSAAPWLDTKGRKDASAGWKVNNDGVKMILTEEQDAWMSFKDFSPLQPKVSSFLNT